MATTADLSPDEPADPRDLPPRRDPGARTPLPRTLLVDASDRGGIARYTRCLRRALEEEHVPVALAAPAGVGDPGLELRGPRWGPDVARMGRVRLYALRLGEVGPCARAFRRAVTRARPEIVHVQTEVVPGLDAWVLARIARRVPVVLTVHDPVPLDGGAPAAADQARRWRAADALIVHSEEPRCFVEASAPGVPVHVVPVDAGFFGALDRPTTSKEMARRRLGLDAAPTALLLGQIRAYKGIGLLARAWPQVVAAVPGARLLIVGEAYDAGDVGLLDGIAGVARHSGFVPEEDLDAWIAAADVMLLPYSAGSHSGVLHRGLAVGTPVLASPPLAEEVYRNRAGRTVPLVPEAWAEALISALGARPLLAPCPPTVRTTAPATVAVYRQVLDARFRAASATTN
jgi:glycosyltransferase involved in cell wall biosynthesis